MYYTKWYLFIDHKVTAIYTVH